MPHGKEVSPLLVDARAGGRVDSGGMAVVAAETYETLSGISAGDPSLLDTAMGLREPDLRGTGLDARTSALARIAALIAVDGPPAAYAWLVTKAIDDGATPEDLLGVLRAVAPQVGAARVVGGALEIMVALGLAHAD
jgi:4-carboxymuconolactone decarboxylase